MKRQSAYFPREVPEHRRGDGGGPRGAHTPSPRGPLLPREHGVWGPRGPAAFALSPTYTPRQNNRTYGVLFQRRVPLRRRHRRRDSGDRSLCVGTLPGRGIAPGAISIDSIAVSIAVADSYDEE